MESHFEEGCPKRSPPASPPTAPGRPRLPPRARWPRRHPLRQPAPRLALRGRLHHARRRRGLRILAVGISTAGGTATAGPTSSPTTASSRGTPFPPNRPERRSLVAASAVRDGEPVCRRDSVVRSSPTERVAIHLSGLPGDIGRADRPTLDLAPGGVYRAARVAPGAGALLPHRCTLACDGLRTVVFGCPSAVCFLWHFPSSRLDWPLASTLPCGVPTFLDRVQARPRPPDRLTVTASVPDI